MRAILLGMLCMTMALCCTCGASAATKYAVWTTSSLEKVFKHTPIKPLEPAAISAAKGEHEAFQVVLRAGRESLKGVSLSASSLSIKSATIPASAVSMYLAHYIYLPEVNQDYPDPLPPYQRPFDLQPGQTQPVWVDVSVPRDAKPGQYAGVITIKASNADTVTVPVTLTVYSFEMPAGPKMQTAFGLWSLKFLELGHGLEANAPEASDLHRKYYDFLLDHGVSTFPNVPGDMESDEWAKWVTDPRCTGFQVDFTQDEQEMRKRLDRIRSLGVWDKAYFYSVDEPSTQEQYDKISAQCAYLRKIDPKVNIVSPYYAPPQFAKDKKVYDYLTGSLSIWCPVTSYYDEKRISERRSAGDKIWDYVCCSPDKPYANFFVDMAPLEHRMLFWQNYLYNVTGLLYWDTIYWEPKSTTDPWQDIASVKWIRDNIYGDGSLLYPGKKVGIDGPVSSIRLEVIRDGIEDYSYLWLLDQKIGREATLDHVKKLTSSFQEYTRDPALFKSVRDEIAKKIESR